MLNDAIYNILSLSTDNETKTVMLADMMRRRGLDAVSWARDSAYALGHKAGYAEGFDAGYDTGYDDGWENGTRF